MIFDYETNNRVPGRITQALYEASRATDCGAVLCRDVDGDLVHVFENDRQEGDRVVYMVEFDC
jgi:hypothetical protein